MAAGTDSHDRQLQRPVRACGCDDRTGRRAQALPRPVMRRRLRRCLANDTNRTSNGKGCSRVAVGAFPYRPERRYISEQNLMKLHHDWQLRGALACLLTALLTLPALAATLEGEAVYRERIMPPAGAILVVSLEDTARADAPATELATSRTRLAAGPPYRWRIDYDERVLNPMSRPVLRARIETPQGLWMTTDTVMSASTQAPVLQLRTVQAPVDRCAAAGTQAALNECAFQAFLTTSAAMSRQLRGIEAGLTAAQRSRWRRVQKAWLTYRTETCQFEASAVGDGSAGPMVQWQCTDRMTKQRTAELLRLAECPEGDIACPIRRSQKTP